jgi:catechol 2,3-dioxygenase-like lactoylglutathione lyase family enzyme
LPTLILLPEADGMILYATLGVADFERSIRFYDAVMASLGVGRAPDWAEDFIGWGNAYGEGFGLWLCRPFDGKAPAPGNGPMLAFEARSAAEVDAFHAAALAHGGTDEGKPGLRLHYTPTFYACYVRDPDGNKLACVDHRYTLE